MNIPKELKGICGVYCITHRDSGRCYVGSSIDIGARIKHHINSANRGVCWKIYHAMRDHGVDSFEVKVLEMCDKEVLRIREKHWIESLDATSPNNFNKCADPTKVPDFIGLAQSKESRDKRSLSLKGRKQSDEIARQRSVLLKEKYKNDPEYRAKLQRAIASTWNPESRAKGDANRRGQKRSQESNDKRNATFAERKAAGLYKPRTYRPIKITQDAKEFGKTISVKGYTARRIAALRSKYENDSDFLTEIENVYARPKSLEWRQSISRSNTGKVRSKEAIAQREATRKARWLAGEYNLKRTPEQIAKMKAAMTGRKMPAAQRAKLSEHQQKSWATRRKNGTDTWVSEKVRLRALNPPPARVFPSPGYAAASAKLKGRKQSPEVVAQRVRSTQLNRDLRDLDMAIGWIRYNLMNPYIPAARQLTYSQA
jgi:group I intron endonuclease